MTDERISDERYSEEEKKDAWGWLYDEFGEVPVPDKEQWRIAAYALALLASHAELMKALGLLLESHSCDDGSVDYDGTKRECEDCIPARAARAQYQKAVGK